MPALRRHRSFSLRSLLVAVTVLGVVIAWLSHYIHWIGERHVILATGGMAFSGRGDRPAPFPLRLVGEPGVNSINPPTDCSDKDCEHIRDLFPEAVVKRQLPLVSPAAFQ